MADLLFNAEYLHFSKCFKKIELKFEWSPLDWPRTYINKKVGNITWTYVIINHTNCHLSNTYIIDNVKSVF